MADPGAPTLEAVIFDWGGTLTPWHTVDFDLEAAAMAEAVLDSDGHAGEQSGPLLRAATEAIWARSRDEHRSATMADVYAEAGLRHDPERLTAYRTFWEPHTLTDPDVAPTFRALRERGLRIGVLSNTVWPAAWHEEIFRRDGVLDLIDGAVYSSEIPVTKPHPDAFRAALDAVRVTDPARAVFVGDRLFDDVWGAQQAGLRAVLVPHSDIPEIQRGHSEGTPDAVARRISDLPEIIAGW